MTKKTWDIVNFPTETKVNECLDCKHEGTDWGEIDVGTEEAEVVCPKCGSYHYYVKDKPNDNKPI